MIRLLKIEVMMAFLLVFIPIVYAEDSIDITNLDVTGFEEINEDYTSVRNVVLVLNFSEDAERCRYLNHDNDSDLPSQDNPLWTSFEDCVNSRIWMLSEGIGWKTVYYQINYTGYKKVLNDSIYYDYTGEGLDTSEPSAPTVTYENYTNNSDSISLSWTAAEDRESELLKIPIEYEVVAYTSTNTLSTNTTTDTSITLTNSTGFNLAHNALVYINVTAINSANLRNTSPSYPNGVRIDLTDPYVNPGDIAGEYLSSGSYISLPGENDWVNSDTVNISWKGTDDVSPISAYSYTLSRKTIVTPDEVPEGNLGRFEEKNNSLFTELDSGKYYFRVRAKDEAGNWGDYEELVFSFDNTEPTKPRITERIKKGNNLTFYWSSAKDDESGVVNYTINLYKDDVFYSNRTFGLVYNHTFENLPSGNYNATVGARNNVSLWKWSDDKEGVTDSIPPVISVNPNGSVYSIDQNVIIRAWSDEKAVCYYNTSIRDVKFRFTNTTYHETKIYDADISYKITCIDMSGNIREGIIDFNIDNNLEPDDVSGLSVTSYPNRLTTLTVNVSDNSDLLTGLQKDDFSFEVNDDETFGLFDRGDGYYDISFMSPNNTGTYSMEVTVSGIPETINLVIEDLFLSTSYEDNSINTPKGLTYITYMNPNNERSLGMGALSGEILIIEDKLTIQNISFKNELYIFNTIADSNLNSKENQLNRFDDLFQPNFGYNKNADKKVNLILDPLGYDLSSDFDELRPGKYNLLTKQEVSSTGEKIVVLKVRK